ncbi:MAG: TlpA family protein disulfide reductase [Desulfobulbales bacterium]
MSGRKAIEGFRNKYHITFPVGKASGVAKELWVNTIPETIFLSRQGRIVKRIRGKMSAAQLTAAVEEIVQ